MEAIEKMSVAVCWPENATAGTFFENTLCLRIASYCLVAQQKLKFDKDVSTILIIAHDQTNLNSILKVPNKEDSSYSLHLNLDVTS